MDNVAGADLAHLDSELGALAREEGALRLRLGQLLEVVGRGAVFELGFSSLGAYVVERCERSVRWGEAARCLARRLEGLPELRRATAFGRVSWTMAELLARVATPADEASWVERGESRTVRQVRTMIVRAAASFSAEGSAASAPSHPVAAAIAGARAAAPPGLAVADDGATDSLASGDAGESCTLTCTVDHEDAWLFEATRCLLEQLGERTLAEQSEALLAEAQCSLLAALPPGAIEVGDERPSGLQRRWVEQLRRWREEAESACEHNVVRQLASARAASLSAGRGETALVASLWMAPLEHMSCSLLDQQVRALSSALASHELALSRLALRFHRADGWRRLGYATETQYARERLGLSRSSLAARRALALRLEKLPGVADALGSGRIGVEAALQLVRVATPSTERAWVERARRRTIKHLREEVAAALVAVRLAGDTDCPPPEDTEMAAFQALEQAVVSGRFAVASAPSACQATAASVPGARSLVEPASEPRRAWCTMLGSLASWLGAGLQMPAVARHDTRPDAPRACRSAGRVELRLRMSRETCAWWRDLEAQARRWLPRGMSWLRFLCLSLWQAWRPLLGADVAYAHIYVRDRYRCMSPVCNRRDVTPHHLHFRSAGGSDEDYNIGSLCTWCHLQGVHGGRIRARGPADHLRWELGPRDAPALVVEGRERIAA